MELAEDDSAGEEVCLVAGDLSMRSPPWAALATEQEDMQDDDEMIPTVDTFEKVSAYSRVFAGLYRTALDAEMNTQVFVVRVARYVYWWDVSGRSINEPAIEVEDGRQKLEDFLTRWRQSYYVTAGAEHEAEGTPSTKPLEDGEQKQEQEQNQQAEEEEASSLDKLLQVRPSTSPIRHGLYAACSR